MKMAERMCINLWYVYNKRTEDYMKSEPVGNMVPMLISIAWIDYCLKKTVLRL